MQHTNAQPTEKESHATATATGLLIIAFCFGKYLGDNVSWLLILLALIILLDYPIFGIPVWLWAILATWLMLR